MFTSWIKLVSFLYRFCRVSEISRSTDLIDSSEFLIIDSKRLTSVRRIMFYWDSVFRWGFYDSLKITSGLLIYLNLSIFLRHFPKNSLSCLMGCSRGFSHVIWNIWLLHGKPVSYLTSYSLYKIFLFDFFFVLNIVRIKR